MGKLPLQIKTVYSFYWSNYLLTLQVPNFYGLQHDKVYVMKGNVTFFLGMLKEKSIQVQISKLVNTSFNSNLTPT